MLDTDLPVTSLNTPAQHHNESGAIMLSTLNGEPVALQAQGNTTVLYFFAPWCQVCHASIGNLQNLFQHNEDVDVIAIALDYTSNEEVLKFTQRHQLTFPIALGDEKTKQAFAITGYPSYYIVDKDNVITAKSMGYSSELGLYLRSL
ncbi:TlpA family protein disulfide reductase [Colwellia sp. D2M02]|uniref:Thioredoxin domain-containing protein n=2 Tax=Colwelliaceae TaxID=267889 RepID=A0ABN1L7W4_9GAMM|nr:TlpA disulfide reductase family protein [Colwellia sp. D2M02]MBU2892508.1 TlpA family protein disulfide reductase [Colwellia sp. D2M02]